MSAPLVVWCCIVHNYRSALDNIWKFAEQKKVDVLRLDKNALETLSGKKPHQVDVHIRSITAIMLITWCRGLSKITTGVHKSKGQFLIKLLCQCVLG